MTKNRLVCGTLMSRQILAQLTPTKNLQFCDKKPASLRRPLGTTCNHRYCLISHFVGQENCTYKLTNVLKLYLLTVTKIVAKCLSLDCSSHLILTHFCFVLVTHPCNPNPCKENQVCDINRSCYGALLDRCQSYTCVPGKYLFIACNEGLFSKQTGCILIQAPSSFWKTGETWVESKTHLWE